jgi:transcriptional regulator with XRE-family HTH domain
LTGRRVASFVRVTEVDPSWHRATEPRAAKDWSQEEFAHVSGLHRTYIGQIERGEKNISFGNLSKVSSVLGVTLAELLFRAGGRRQARCGNESRIERRWSGDEDSEAREANAGSADGRRTSHHIARATRVLAPRETLHNATQEAWLDQIQVTLYAQS